MSQVAVTAKDLKKSYGRVHALDGVSLELEKAQQYSIMGASGSGKSTLLYLVAGLDTPSSGSIMVEGEDLAKFSDEKLAEYRNRHVGLIFQFHFLLSTMNCLNNILLPARIGNVPVEDVRKRAEQLAEQLGVTHCLNRRPYELSGGEQQRINIIRALSLRPKLLLCDEPTGNLDSQNSRLVTELLSELAREFEATLVVVTHDQNVASHFPRCLRLKDGKLCTD